MKDLSQEGKRTAIVAMTAGKKAGRLRNSARPPPPWTPVHDSTARTRGHQTPKAGRQGAPDTPVPEPGEKESHKRGGSQRLVSRINPKEMEIAFPLLSVLIR